MKINQAQIKSALRHFVITAVAVYTADPNQDVKALIAGVVAAIVGPAIRAIDVNDPAFGNVAVKVEDKIKKAAKKTKK